MITMWVRYIFLSDEWRYGCDNCNKFPIYGYYEKIPGDFYIPESQYRVQRTNIASNEKMEKNPIKIRSVKNILN